MVLLSQSEIKAQSYALQSQLSFYSEKKLLLQALTQYPNWDYVHQRLAWHQRPTLHENSHNSKMVLRKPLHLPRVQAPQQKTIDSMCFCTGASSNAPYFMMCVEQLESIKATRWYSRVPIKIIDCGLTPEDADFLRVNFNAEVKDPGWDIPLEGIDTESGWGANNGAFKNISGHFYADKHFPGFQYYFWIDSSTWIQDERILDRYLLTCEKAGLCGTTRWNKSGAILGRDEVLSREMFMPDAIQLEGHYFTVSTIHCFGVSALKLARQKLEETLASKKYMYGTDDTILTWLTIQYGQESCMMLDDVIAYYSAKDLTIEDHVLYRNNTPMGFVIRQGGIKYRMRPEYTFSPIELALFYRVYPTPEELYGPLV